MDVVGDSQIKVEMVRDVIQNVKISGPAATNGKSLVTNQFLLDAREAIVSGGLNAFMQGPGNVEVGFKENLDGNFCCSFFRLITLYKLFILKEQFMSSTSHRTVECIN